MRLPEQSYVTENKLTRRRSGWYRVIALSLFLKIIKSYWEEKGFLASNTNDNVEERFKNIWGWNPQKILEHLQPQPKYKTLL